MNKYFNFKIAAFVLLFGLSCAVGIAGLIIISNFLLNALIENLDPVFSAAIFIAALFAVPVTIAAIVYGIIDREQQ